MKNEESQKITALGVVIFSFFSLLICFSVIALVDAITAFLVLKTTLPEAMLKVGSVIGSGVGIIISTAFLTAKGKVKGIVSASIIALIIISIKILGNSFMDMGGYFSWNGFAGILFTMVFSLIGGVLGSSLKMR